MNEGFFQRSAQPTLSGGNPRAEPMAMCPMAKMCERVMEKPHSASLLLLPGALLIALGVLILVEPRIVSWLVAGAAILIGLMFFMMARLIGRMRKRPVST